MNKDERTRILFYIETSGYGGCEKHLLELIEGLGQKDFAPNIIVQTRGAENADLLNFLAKLREVIGRYDDSEIFVVTNRFSNLTSILNPMFVWEVCRICRRSFSIIHFYKSSIARCTAATLIAKLSSARSLQTIQLPPDRNGKWKFPTSRLRHAWYLSLTRLVISVSDSFRRECVEYYRLPPERVVTVHNSIRIERFCIPKIAQAQLRFEKMDQFGIGRDSFVFVSIARLDEQKGHKYLLDAFRLLRDIDLLVYEKAVVLCCGSGELESELRSQVQDLDLQHKIQFLGYRDDVVDLLSISDALILTSVKEGLPLTVAEAMGMRKPVIATAVDGTPEIVVNDLTGYLVPPRDPSSIAEAIIRLVRAPVFVREQMGQAGYERVNRDFNHRLQTEKIKEQYRCLIPLSR
jgi:glycosyltransferase involved in cell wall biosynthesis